MLPKTLPLYERLRIAVLQRSVEAFSDLTEKNIDPNCTHRYVTSQSVFRIMEKICS